MKEESNPIIGPDQQAESLKASQGGVSLSELNPEELERALRDEERGVEVAKERENKPPAFWTSEEKEWKGAQYKLLKEEPQHRVICYLAAEGNTNVEIAEKTGFTTAMVAYVKKQPWAQTRIAEILEKSGQRAVTQVLEGAALEAAKLICHVVTDDKVKIEERAKQANKLLDRLYGVAPQTVRHQNIDPSEMDDDALKAILMGQKVAEKN